jgi:hypothetical protein
MAIHQVPDAAGSLANRAHARSGISFAPDWETAVDETLRDAMTGSVGAPDLLVMFVSSAWSHAYQRIVDRVRTETGTACLIGCSSSGVIAGASCHESAPGLTLMAVWLPGAVISPLRIENVPTAWPWDDTVQADDVRGIILFSEPYRTDAQSTLVGLRATCPGMPMVGALAGTSRADRRAWVYLDGDVYSQGAVAVAIEGPYDLLVNVSLGGTPIGSPWTITSVDHNQIITISNRPAIEVMHDTLDEIAARGFGASDLLVGFPMDSSATISWLVASSVQRTQPARSWWVAFPGRGNRSSSCCAIRWRPQTTSARGYRRWAGFSSRLSAVSSPAARGGALPCLAATTTMPAPWPEPCPMCRSLASTRWESSVPYAACPRTTPSPSASG